MHLFRKLLAPTIVVLAGATGSCPGARALPSPPTLGGHPIRLDAAHKLLSWWTGDAPFAHVAGLAWHAMETRFPPQDNGIETWLSNSRFDPDTCSGINWPHNPAGLYAMLTDSAVLWYEFSGDRAAIDVVRKALDYQIAHGTTPASWDWARVPYASANAGDLDYAGADDSWCNACGRGDGTGVIEPDKVGELGFAYMQMYELTGDARYRAEAQACADALAEHVREGDDQRSPWPFRVYAQSGVAREEYSANVVGALMLFDELERLSIGDVADYHHARTVARDWLLRVPLKNDAWSGYFEDIDIQTDPGFNTNQYAPMRTARWLLQHRDEDPDWHDHVTHLIGWVAQTFGGDTAREAGLQWGARVISEQIDDVVKMGSHTARFGATNALWFAATGDAVARERAMRSLNWSTYACAQDGIVAVGDDPNEGWWFSDGYGDYIRHFMVAMAAVPQWAPRHENHLLESTSIVTHVDYGNPSQIAWSTFDADSTETLRLRAPPTQVTVRGKKLPEATGLEGPGYTVHLLPLGDAVVRIRHEVGGPVVVAARP
ncbi:MAG: hypothetical protein ACRENE_08495 [Polyangiaceae bacterium]